MSASELESLAETFCASGYHIDASIYFGAAGEAYELESKHLDAARCYAQEHLEMKWAQDHTRNWERKLARWRKGGA